MVAVTRVGLGSVVVEDKSITIVGGLNEDGNGTSQKIYVSDLINKLCIQPSTVRR